MAKQEVLDAINATVVPNNMKGITANSLRNVLTLMAENAGSGSGEGALRVMVPLAMFGDAEVTEMEFTPEYWETMKLELEGIAPGLSSALDPIVEEIFRHNAEVYPKLMEKAAKNEGVMCLLDLSAYLKGMMEFIITLEGPECSFNALSVSIPSRTMIIEAEPAEVVAELEMPFGIHIKPLSYNHDLGIQPFTAVELRADGSLRMYIDAYEIDYVYVPKNDESVLTDNEKAFNALWLMKGYPDTIKEVRANSAPIGKIVYYSYGLVRYFQRDETTGITSLKQAKIADDGSVTVTTLGTLNTPTE